MLEKGRRVVAGHQLARVRLFHAHLDASGGWVDFGTDNFLSPVILVGE
jgi:hypothetical protein